MPHTAPSYRGIGATSLVCYRESIKAQRAELRQARTQTRFHTAPLWSQEVSDEISVCCPLCFRQPAGISS